MIKFLKSFSPRFPKTLNKSVMTETNWPFYSFSTKKPFFLFLSRNCSVVGFQKEGIFAVLIVEVRFLKPILLFYFGMLSHTNFWPLTYSGWIFQKLKILFSLSGYTAFIFEQKSFWKLPIFICLSGMCVQQIVANIFLWKN